MRKFVRQIGLGSAIIAALSTPLLAVSVIVPGSTNVFVAGQETTGINTVGGLFPTAIGVAGMTSLSFSSITGTTTCGTSFCAPSGGIGADGATLSPDSGPQDGTNIPSMGNGISGIQFAGREMFLVGVFLDNNIPTGAGPSALAYSGTGASGANSAANVTAQALILGQVFYIGDGRTGMNDPTGALEGFIVPTGATRLFLGFADSFYNFAGVWGAYGDNIGALNVEVAVDEAPEPGTVMLLGLGLSVLALLRKKVVHSTRHSG